MNVSRKTAFLDCSERDSRFAIVFSMNQVACTVELDGFGWELRAKSLDAENHILPGSNDKS